MGGSHVELVVTVGRDLSGVRLQLRGEDGYVDWFTFPRQAVVAKGERLRIYEDTAPDDLPPPRRGQRPFVTGTTALRRLAGAGHGAAGGQPHGLVEEVIPLHPVLAWVDIDPARLRLVHTADTRARPGVRHRPDGPSPDAGAGRLPSDPDAAAGPGHAGVHLVGRGCHHAGGGHDHRHRPRAGRVRPMRSRPGRRQT